MKSEHKKFIADHGRYILAVFFFVPMFISQCAIWIGATDIGFVSPWETSYRAVFGEGEGYSFIVVMYWVMSPLAFLWWHSQVNYQGMTLKRAIIVIPVVWLLLIGIGVLVFDGGAVSSPQKNFVYSFPNRVNAARGISLLRKWHVGFCVLYGGLIYIFCFWIYMALCLTFRLISNRLKKE